MKRYEKYYQKLSKKYTDEEITEFAMIPQDLTPEEQEQSNAKFREFRLKWLEKRTEEERIMGDLVQLRFKLEDYLKEKNYDEDKSFGKYLEEYARILKRTKKRLSEDLGIHYTRLSRIINDKEEPNIALAYRLEEHSDKLISAILWWKLVIKKQEFLIRQNESLRKIEAAKVKNAFKFRA